MANKIFIPLVIAVAVVVVTTGLLSTQTWNPSWNPFKPGEGALEKGLTEKAIVALLEVKTVKYESSGEVAVEGAPQIGKVVLNMNGAIDASEAEKNKTEATLNISVAAQDKTFSGGIDLKIIGKEIYLKITSLPDIPVPTAYQETFDALKSQVLAQWIKIDIKKLQELAGVKTEPTDTGLEAKSKAFLEDLKALIKDKALFDVEKDLGEEEVDGEKSRHYSVSVNKESLKVLIPAYIELAKKHGLTNLGGQGLSEQDLQQALTEIPNAIDELWLKIGGVKFEVWVRKSGTILKQFRFEREISGKELQELAKETDKSSALYSESTKVKLKIDIKFLDFNKPVEITAPAEAKGIEEILLPLMMQQRPSLAPEENSPQE